jgi:type I restriction enzyme S subunit
VSKSWPRVPLKEVLTKANKWIDIKPDEQYQEVTVRLWGKGVVKRRDVAGAEIAATRRQTVQPQQFILSRIDARNGAFGLVPDLLDGAIVSNDFPVFDLNHSRIIPRFLGWMSKTGWFVDLCRHASEGTTNRVRLKEDRFLKAEIPIPPLPEQQRIVARIEELAAKIEEVNTLRQSIEQDEHQMLLAVFRRMVTGAPRRPMSKVAPLFRRPISVEYEKEYPQVAVRSFGKGTFHKPALQGAEVTWQKPYLVKSGDILISNIKAWEGAVAVATEADDERVGSHRYLTCVPTPKVTTPLFVCFYLLTAEGLHELGEASPGSADRNRTLSTKALMNILIPMPPYDEQRRFDDLCQRLSTLKRLQTETAAELDALQPSILDRTFKGGI